MAAAADASSIIATGSVYLAAVDGDVFAVAVAAAADASTTAATDSGHLAAGDSNVVRSIIGAAADAGTTKPTGGRQAAGFFIIVLQGQRACGDVFFKTSLTLAAFQLVIAVQLDGHIAVSLNTQSGFSVVAHIDLYVFQGEVQHLIDSVVDRRNGVAQKARGSRRGCLLGLGLLSAFMLVGSFLFLSALRLGRLVVVLYHRAKAGILCCGALQVALQRGGSRSSGGDDDLTTVIVGISVL